MKRWLRDWVLLVVAPGLAAAAQNDVPARLPVGDGHVSARAQAGSVFACQTQFGGGGARLAGAWFHGDTWNPLEKPHVQGEVMWPEARLKMVPEDTMLAVAGNGLPVGEPTGTFPIAANDPAYQFDTNPNGIKAQTMAFRVPLHPVKAAVPGCLPMGMVGFTVTGVAFFNALDAQGRDAAAHEVQDRCDGHPQRTGQYHYHSSSPCLPGAMSNTLVGWALDGYPILGMRDAQGKLLSDAQLDACHGRAEPVQVSGRTYDYAYRLTPEYPYTLGCFTGEVAEETRTAMRKGMGAPPRNGPGARPER